MFRVRSARRTDRRPPHAERIAERDDESRRCCKRDGNGYSERIGRAERRTIEFGIAGRGKTHADW
jgi:hypothetical protein